MRQAAVVDVKVRIENGLALGTEELRLGFDPFRRFLLPGVRHEPRFQISNDFRILLGDIRRFVGIFGKVE